MAMNEGEVIFRLIGDDFNPDQVTTFLGIQPSKIKRKSSPVPKCNTWEFSLGKIKDEFVDIYDMSSNLVQELEPKLEFIVEAIKKYDLAAVLQVVLWITMDDSKSTPAIGFDKETIKFLNKINASIDIDTYRH